MMYQMLPCHSTAAAMETVQCAFERAAKVVSEVWRNANPFLNIFVILVQEMTWLVVVCVFWWLLIYMLYHPFKLYFQGRHQKARQNKLLHDHREHAEKEKAFIARYWSLAGSSQHPSQAPEIITNSRVSGDNLPLVPVKMCCTCTLLCGGMSCKRELKKMAAKYLLFSSSAFTKEIIIVRLEMCKQPRAVSDIISISRGCLQIIRHNINDDEVKPLDIDDNDSSDQNNRVPVIFNAFFKADILTVEGLNLAKASIHVVNKRGDCFLLETGCNGESEPGVARAGGLDIHTSMYEPSIKDRMRIDEFSVIAFKMIVQDGSEVRVGSLPVQIQDDSLRTVLLDILPSMVIHFLAVKQISSSVGFATIIVAWLISFVIVALTLPESMETMFKQLLEKSKAHVCIFYEVYWTYMYKSKKKVQALDSEDEEDAGDSELDKKDITDNNLKKKMHLIRGKAAEDQSGFVHSADWQWPVWDKVHCEWESKLVLRVEKKDENVDQNAKTVPFEVIYLNLKDLPWASQVRVDISSPFLKSLFPLVDTDRWKLSKKKAKIYGPSLFRNYATLSAHRVSCVAKVESQEPGPSRSNIMEELQHITHLVRFMDKEFEDIAPMYAAMEIARQVTWEMLWAFLPPGERVVYADETTDECVCGEVLQTEYQSTALGRFLQVKVTKWDYNCQSWNEYTNEVTVPAFSGDCEFKRLSIRPLRCEEDPHATESFFLDHGKRFCELSMMQSNCFMKYKGSQVSFVRMDSCLKIVKENADGRVMIDLGSFAKMNPDFTLGSAKPPCEIIRNNITISVDVTQSPNRMFAPSFVYGFSFRLKKWGCFSVAGFTDIEFNDSAYDELVMDPAKKELTYSLVQERLKEGSRKKGWQIEADRVDPIADKGDGCILLCYGPPGTGKTLTAESLSEKLQCPLWCLSVFELGVTPSELEEMLVKVLDIAASWGAILLLDEADVYLERRSSNDLVRNSMTGVFLRHLEYYRGVLFLTTNRDAEFDEAICSRITMFLYYGRLDESQRSSIWKTLFGRVGLEDCTSDILAEFSKHDFNGREITKIVKTAQTLARNKKERLEFQHVRKALKVYGDSSNLRASLNFSAGASTLPAHQQPNKKHLERFSTSGPPDSTQSSSRFISTEVAQEQRPVVLSLSSNLRPEAIEGIQTSESSWNETSTSGQCNVETIEVVTPVSPSNTIDHVSTAHAFYRR